MAFSFLVYLFVDIHVFVFMQMRKVMTSWVVSLKQHNIQLRITLEILKQCSSNLAPAVYITKETE